MDPIGVEGKTLKVAIDLACEQLGVGHDQLRYKLDVAHFRDSMGKARGVDTVRILAWAEANAEPSAPKAEPVARSEAPPKAEPAPRAERAPRAAAPPKPAPAPAPVESEDDDDGDERDESDAGEPGEPRSLEAIEGLVGAFIEGALTRTGFKAQVGLDSNEDRIQVTLAGLDTGDVDRSRVTKALKSIEYLANRLSAGDRERLPRVSMTADEEDQGDRAEKEAALEAVASKVVAQVLRDARPLTLKPMNSYERRIIHLAVSRFDGVGSRSIGDGQRKRVQVYPAGGAD